MFSELLQIADIVRSAFHHLATHWYCGSLFWVQAIPAQECHEIIQNRLALLAEESVSVGHRRHPLSLKSGEPTHAHLHHRQ